VPRTFPERAPRAGKASRGRTSVAKTPIAIRSRVDLEQGFDERIRKDLARKLGRAAPLLERGTVRFEDVNGPRGGVDTLCRIKLVLSGRPSVQVEQVGVNPEMAFALAVPAVVRALERARRKHGLRAGPAPRGRQHVRRGAVPVMRGSIIGRRVGRGPKAQARALARPEKRRRDAYVDTSRPGVSASHRRAGGPTTARRNAMANPRRAASTLEDSRKKPSRKSTRRGANRGKPSQRKERAALARSLTPSAKAARNIARARR
jgi:hypothetical protein